MKKITMGGGDGMLTYVTHVNQQVWTTRNWFRPDDTQILSSGTRYYEFKMADNLKPGNFENL